MPELENLHHEQFCLLIARGLEHGKAFAKARDPRLAPPKNIRQSAYGLLRNPIIQARIAELKQIVQQSRLDAAQVTAAAQVQLIQTEVKIELIERQWVIKELKDNVDRAKAKGHFDGSVANRALELLGKEIGMFIDRSENYNVNNEIRSEPLSEKEWAEQFAGSQSKPN